MQRLGFIHDMMDVKILILFVAARSNYPMTTQQIYELCYQDECLSYFDGCTAIPEMVTSGHLEKVDEEHYTITEKGRQDGELTADSIAFTVKQRAENAVARFNRQLRRSSMVGSRVIPRENGETAVILTLNDSTGTIMTLELMAPDQRQGVRLGKLFEKKADVIYNLIMNELLEAEAELDG